MSILGIQNATPVFSMVPTIGPFKPTALIPTITEEDEVILNNVQKVVEFLTAGSSLSRTSGQVIKNSLLKVMIFICALLLNKQAHFPFFQLKKRLKAYLFICVLFVVGNRH